MQIVTCFKIHVIIPGGRIRNTGHEHAAAILEENINEDNAMYLKKKKISTFYECMIKIQ